MTKIKLRDPQKLRRHKLHLLPPPDETTPEWYSFSDALQARGPEKCPAVVITESGFVVDGWRRVMAARAWQWPQIRCELCDDDEAAAIMVDSLFGQRDMSRGAKVYFALPLLEDYSIAAEKRRLANLRQNRKTNENPLILPKSGDRTSELTRDAICARFGVQKTLLHSCIELRDILHNPASKALAELIGPRKRQTGTVEKLQEELCADYEPQLLTGEKSVWFVRSAIAGRLRTEDEDRSAGVALQLDFWAGHLHPMMSAVQKWSKVPAEVRARVLCDVRTFINRLPESDRLEILGELA